MNSLPEEPLGETRGTVALVVVLSAGASALAYRSVLGSYFWSDDFVLFYMLRDMSLPEFLFTPFGGHTLVARMRSSHSPMPGLDSIRGRTSSSWSRPTR